MFKNGFLTIGSFRRAPIRLHWTLPLGAFFFGHFQFVPGFWLAFTLLILIHELGHAFMVVLCKQRVLAVDVQGFGGLCTWDGAVTEMQRCAIAWGGVLAQAALLIVTYVALMVFGRPTSGIGWDIVAAFTTTNLYIIGFNLLPMPPLDGVEAWRIIPLLRERFAKRGARPGVPKPKGRATEKELRAERLRRAGPRLRVLDGGGSEVGITGEKSEAAVTELFDKLKRERDAKRGGKDGGGGSDE